MCLRFLFVLVAIKVALPVAAEEIRIAASDLLADFIAEPLQAYGDEHSIEFVLDRIGSLPALDALRASEIDLAIIAVPEKAAVPHDEFQTHLFAYDVAVVAVNENNPINEISLSSLGAVFGSDEEFDFSSWGDLGLSGWHARSIKPLVGEADASISLELFKFSVLGGRPLKTSVVTVKNAEVEHLLISDSASIAILQRLPNSQKIKALMISTAADSPAFGPTDDNIHYGDYPIRLVFYSVYHPRNEARVRDLLRVLWSDEMADSLRMNDVFPLPYAVRRTLITDLDFKE